MKKMINISPAMMALTALALLLPGGSAPLQAQGTKFTYQGRLLDAGSPASGSYDLRFTVWDSAACGSGLQIGAPVVVNPVPVSGGLFAVPLDFGAGVFTGPTRWLQVESRLSGGSTYSAICPRQELTPTPYAMTAGTLTGSLPDGGLSPNVALLNRNLQTFTGTNQFGGSISFTNPMAGLQFPATSAANAPMLNMFASGTGNANRMVIGHSPAYPDWGLQYEDVSDKFHFLAQGIPVMTVSLGTLSVGIGRTNPAAALDVNGSVVANGFIGSGAGLTNISFLGATVLQVNCVGDVTYGTNYVKVGDLGVFTKQQAASTMELTFNGRLSATTITNSTGCTFELRVDNAASTLGWARAVVKAAEAGGVGVQSSITGMFTGLAAGSHTVSMWVKSLQGGGTGAYVDPGCWSSAHVVIKELK